MWVGGQRHVTAALRPGKGTSIPCGLQDGYVQVRKIIAPAGIRSRTIKPVASRYTE